MADSPKILVFAGSARRDSQNKKLAARAAAIAKGHGAAVTLIDLADYDAPIYSGDIESASGLPETMRQLKAQFASHDGFLISTPEYNGHVPPLLINCFSWASRAENEERSMVAFAGKKAGLMAASPGRLGGIRVLPRLRSTLADLGVMVVPGFVSLPGASKAFSDDGTLSEDVESSIAALVQRLTEAVK
jgi:NAD(P)H-dependent FMN reductase